MKKKLTQKKLMERLDYNPETGVFTSRLNYGRILKGEESGYKKKTGYISIQVLRRYYGAHRLAWLYVYGEFPDGNIDHINGDKTDNRIANLRIATPTQNVRNIGLRKSNTLGRRGVCKSGSKFMARIKDGSGKNLYLGTFDTIDEAGDAYEEKARELHGEFYREIKHD